MKTMRSVWPVFSVSVERDMISVDVIHRVKVPDPDWRYIDKKGHGHFWKKTKLPTMKQVVVGTQWVGDEYDGEEYEIKEWRCKLCDETIDPGMKDETPPTKVPGPTTVTITVQDREYRLSPEQYAESIEAWEKALIEITALPPW